MPHIKTAVPKNSVKRQFPVTVAASGSCAGAAPEGTAKDRSGPVHHTFGTPALIRPSVDQVDTEGAQECANHLSQDIGNNLSPREAAFDGQ